MISKMAGRGMTKTKELRIKILTLDILNGIKRSDILTKYSKEWGISNSSFDRLIAEAAKEVDIIIKGTKQSEINDLKDSIIKKQELVIGSQLDVDAKLWSIINGECIVDDVFFWMGEAVPYKRKPTVSEINQAIKTYNARFGSNAAQKLEANIVSIPAPVIKLSEKK